jgi:hypothetical protein
LVRERSCHVYVLFGNVIATLDEPGLNFLWPKLGWKALVIHWLGRVHVLDLRLDQPFGRASVRGCATSRMSEASTVTPSRRQQGKP